MSRADEGHIAPVGGYPYDTWRYMGQAGVAEFEASTAMHGGRAVMRDGKPVRSIWLASLRWVGDREGHPVGDADRAQLVAELRRICRAEGRPFELVFPSGQVEDETGTVRPGFRSALPRAEYSTGWTVVDLFLSPEFPDAAEAPPTVEYSDPSGTAHIPRQIEVVEGTRLSLLDPAGMRWVGERSGEPLSQADRRRILGRVRMAYERWGHAYKLRPPRD